MNHNILKRETVIYGGAFNPPTRAHQDILQACVDYAERNDADVWLMPSGTRTDKGIDVVRETRLAYVHAMAEHVVSRTVSVGVEVMELDRQIATETIDTVHEMDAKYPERTFTWVFGSDSISTMPEWSGGQWLVDNLPMLIVERAGSPIQALGKNAMWLDVQTDPISSTIVRQRLKQCEPVEGLVIPEIEKLLLASGSSQ